MGFTFSKKDSKLTFGEKNIPENWSLSIGRYFSESVTPQKMMQNGIDEMFWGRTLKNTSYFNLRTSEFWCLGPELEILVPGSWYQDLGTRILIPRSWCQDLGTKILVPKKKESLRGGASKKLSDKPQGAAEPLPGGMGS